MADRTPAEELRAVATLLREAAETASPELNAAWIALAAWLERIGLAWNHQGLAARQDALAVARTLIGGDPGDVVVPDRVYIAEYICFEENPVDGRTRLGASRTLPGALAAIWAHPVHGRLDLVATLQQDSALHGEDGRTWAVHGATEEPDDFGSLWITEERLRPVL